MQNQSVYIFKDIYIYIPSINATNNNAELKCIYF